MVLWETSQVQIHQMTYLSMRIMVGTAQTVLGQNSKISFRHSVSNSRTGENNQRDSQPDSSCLALVIVDGWGSIRFIANMCQERLMRQYEHSEPTICAPSVAACYQGIGHSEKLSWGDRKNTYLVPWIGRILWSNTKYSTIRAGQEKRTGNYGITPERVAKIAKWRSCVGRERVRDRARDSIRRTESRWENGLEEKLLSMKQVNQRSEQSIGFDLFISSVQQNTTLI